MLPKKTKKKGNYTFGLRQEVKNKQTFLLVVFIKNKNIFTGSFHKGQDYSSMIKLYFKHRLHSKYHGIQWGDACGGKVDDSF